MFVNLLLEHAPVAAGGVRVAIVKSTRARVLRIMVAKAIAYKVGLQDRGKAAVLFGYGGSNDGVIRIRLPTGEEHGYTLTPKPRSRDLMLQIARHPDYVVDRYMRTTRAGFDIQDGVLVVTLPVRFLKPSRHRAPIVPGMVASV